MNLNNVKEDIKVYIERAKNEIRLVAIEAGENIFVATDIIIIRVCDLIDGIKIENKGD